MDLFQNLSEYFKNIFLPYRCFRPVFKLQVCFLAFLGLHSITHGDVVRLSEDNFDKIVRDPTKNVLVYFYSPNCRPCQVYAYVYDSVVDDMKENKNCILAKVNVLEEEDLSERYKVASYPTLIFFPKANKNGEDMTYLQEAETEQETQLKNFLDKECNQPGSGPAQNDEKAGLLEDYAPVVKLFMESKVAIEDSMIQAEALQSLQRDVKMAKYYVKVMKETFKSIGFLEKEYRHHKATVSEATLDAGKREQAYKRMNILKEFDPFVVEKIIMKDTDPTIVREAEIPAAKEQDAFPKVEL